VTSSVDVFEAAIRVKSMYVYDRIMIEYKKKKKNMEIKEILAYITLHLIHNLGMDFTSC